MSRIGVYGGSFNPPHIGHVAAAREAIDALSLDWLLVIPTYQAPHKQALEGAPDPETRLRLTRLAFEDVPKAEVSDLEILRQGVSYTVDTLELLHEAYPEDELILLMGTDMLLSFSGWRMPDRIAKLAQLAVMHRQDASDKLLAKLDEAIAQIERDFGGRVTRVENRPVEISSTEARRMIVFGLPDFGLAEPVSAAIREQGLYGWGGNLKNLPFDRLREVSLDLHDEKRRPHVIGCCETAEQLALRWGEDPAAARRAGILHDITKALSPQAQLAVCDRYGAVLTPFARTHPKMLHAKSGAVIAERIFGEDPKVCDAICWHTTGKPNMTLLEKIIYLADYMEPNRGFPGVERLRAVIWDDLDAALLEGLSMSLTNLRARKKPIDENTMAAWQYLANERSK